MREVCTLQFVSSCVDNKTVESFLAAGFEAKTNESQDDPDLEVYLSKKMKCEDLPYVSKHLVNDSWILGSDECAVDLLPDGSIQLVIFEQDYCERYSKEEDPAAWFQMAKDAGVVFCKCFVSVDDCDINGANNILAQASRHFY